MSGAIDPHERERLDSLIAMANTVGDRPERPRNDVGDHTLPWAVLFVGVAGLVIGGLAGYVLGRQDAHEVAAPPSTLARPVEFSVSELETIAPSTAAPGAVAVASATTAVPPTTLPAVTTAAEPTTTVVQGPTTTGPTPPFAPFVARQVAGKPNLAMYDGASLVLSGSIATPEMAAAWAAHVDAVFDLPVVNDLSIDPSKGDAVGFASFPGACFFAEASTSASPSCQELVGSIARAVVADPEARVSVYGNSDSDSTLARIAELAELRADTVRDLLVINGVPASRITLIPRGSDDPLGDNATPEGRSLNRRADITIDDLRP